MKKLALIDDTFLRLESRRQPFHIGMLLLFDPPEGASEDFVYELDQKLREYTTTAPPFNQRLVEKKGSHYWDEDDDFDLEKHFVHLALPRPGRIRELLAMVSRLHSQHLDRSYPLWNMYLIEGIEDGRFAVYLKIHHSMADGVTGIQMVTNSLSNDIEASKHLPPVWVTGIPSDGTTSQPVIPNPTAGSISALRSLRREGLKSIKPLAKQLRHVIKDFRAKNPHLAVSGRAPKSLLNQNITGTRRFAAQSYSAPRIRAVARTFDATSNDVILTMVSGALRRYLEENGEFNKYSLLAGVPVSTRRPGHKSNAANEVAFTIADLASNIDDPAERLAAVKACMDYNKERYKDLSPGQIQALAGLMLMPGALSALFGPKDKTVANLCVSHVPGPREDMYWYGAKLSGLYPISLLVDFSAINITIISRHDKVDFGLIACRKSLPSVQRILTHLEDALVELEEAAQKKLSKAEAAKVQREGKAAPKKKAVAHKKVSVKKKTAAKKKASASVKPSAKKVAATD